ncbi:MAG: DinB family protein [Bacteroidia bacterium]
MYQEKETTLAGIHEAVAAVTERCSGLSEDFATEHHIPGKWSIAEQVVHLIVATRAPGKAFGMPKLAIRAFGSSSKGSRDYDAMAEFYQSQLVNVPARTGFEPDLRGKPFAEIMEKWQGSARLFDDNLPRWSEKELDKRQLPHPLLGKITLREMLFFTHHHIYHHLKQIDRLLEFRD